MRILIVDDDDHIREVARFALEQANYAVEEATNGAQALEVFEAMTPAADLVVLDVMMPEMDGLEVCRRLRANHPTPIIFLSSRGDEFDRVLGLEMGADDYLAKPFSPRELVARVKAMLRRLELDRGPQQTPTTLLEVGDVSLDSDARQVTFSGAVIDLTPTEFNLLKTLMRRPSKVFSRDELMQSSYESTTYVSDRTIDSHVRHIREKFGPHNHDPIETVHGVGYRLAR